MSVAFQSLFCWLHVFIVIAIIILNFFPLYLGYYYVQPDDDYGIGDTLYNSTSLKIALVCSIMSGLPLLFESALTKQNSIVDNYSFFKLACLLTLPDLYILLVGIPYFQLDIIHGIATARDTLFVYLFLFDLTKFCPEVYSTRQWFTILVFYSFCNFVPAWITMFYEMGDHVLNGIHNFQYTCIAIFLFEMLFSLTIVLFRLKKKYGTILHKDIKNAEVTTVMVSIIMFVYALGNWAIIMDPTIGWDWAWTLGEHYMTYYCYLISTVALIYGYFMFRIRLNLHNESEREKFLYQFTLKNMLPPIALSELKSIGFVRPHVHEKATVFFSDIEGFTSIASNCSAEQIMLLLNRLYCLMDHIASYFPTLYKVETIGDAYVIAGGILTNSDDDHDHAVQIANFSLLVNHLVNLIKIPACHQNGYLRIRIGIHSGSLVSGVIGKMMMRYSLFGDTMNIASRMESTGMVGKIHISSSTAAILQNKEEFVLAKRGPVSVKGIGQMETYWLSPSDTNNVFTPTFIEKIQGEVLQFLDIKDIEIAEEKTV